MYKSAATTQFFITLISLLLPATAQSEFRQYRHVGPMREHIASIELIQNRATLKKDGNTEEGKETPLKHLGYGFLTKNFLAVPGRQAKQIRSYLLGKYSDQKPDLSGLTRTEIKLFTVKKVSGAAYIRAIPDTLHNPEWQDEELVMLPLSTSPHLNFEAWLDVTDNTTPIDFADCITISPFNRIVSHRDNGQKDILVINFDLEKKQNCTTPHCFGWDEKDTYNFIIRSDDENTFIGMATICNNERCPIAHLIIHDYAYIKPIAALSGISLFFISAYIFLAKVSKKIFRQPILPLHTGRSHLTNTNPVAYSKS